MHIWTCIILGITGDLSKRKIIPALYALIRRGYTINIIGTGQSPQIVDDILAAARPFIADIDHDTWTRLRAACLYQQIEFGSQDGFEALARLIDQVEAAAQARHRLVYCAIPTDFYAIVTHELIAANIISPHNQHHRIAYEKPFGHDLESAQLLNQTIAQLLDEMQIYYIDHYLAKDMVQSLPSLRFFNSIMKEIWNGANIDHITLRFYESIGIEGRAAFYDRYGVVKDIIQNHLLQITSLVTMREPTDASAHALHNAKAQLLQRVRVDKAIFGQYEGYTDEPGVNQASVTPTYAAVKLSIKDDLWQDVPIYLITGKCLERKATEIEIVFKSVHGHSANLLLVSIMPQERIEMRLNGRDDNSISLCYGTNHMRDAYELIIEACMKGDHAYSVRFDEVEQQWRITDQILALQPHLFVYCKGSCGPQESLTFF